MSKLKIIFVIGSFNVGGAEKSMVNQLNLLDSNRYDIYAYVFNDTGLLKRFLPNNIKYIPTDATIEALEHRPSELKYFINKPILWCKKIIRTSIAKIFRYRYNEVQLIWKFWKKEIPYLEDEFDIAVGHQEGMCNYYVIDKVKAKRKILWIHSLYEKLHYNINFDYFYFSQANAVVTISNVCKQNLIKFFPTIEKFHCLQNISSIKLIKDLSTEQLDENIFLPNRCNIVSIGRLAYPKNFALAIKVAYCLKERGFSFRWIIIGEGSYRKMLESEINRLHLSNEVQLIGVRHNPYNYLAKADIAVQTSHYEGKSIFADEARILGKLFITTNYDTVNDVIKHRETGIISTFDPATLADDIINCYNDVKLQDKIKQNLLLEDFADITNIDKYYYIYECV